METPNSNNLQPKSDSPYQIRYGISWNILELSPYIPDWNMISNTYISEIFYGKGKKFLKVSFN